MIRADQAREIAKNVIPKDLELLIKDSAEKGKFSCTYHTDEGLAQYQINAIKKLGYRIWYWHGNYEIKWNDGIVNTPLTFIEDGVQIQEKEL